MPLLLVRHASAGDRRAWSGDDRLRPLDGRGRRQADGLVPLLSPFAPRRLLSSPYVRCVQTLEPLAAAFGLPVEEELGLAEGAGLAAPGLARACGDATVLCTHGDVIEELVGPDRRKQKGSTWVLEVGALMPLRYLPPPA